MRVLVTGAAGFVGGHMLAELVEHGHEPIAMDQCESGHADLPWYTVNMLDRNSGHFHYRRICKFGLSWPIAAPYIRWSDAWMFAALSKLNNS